MTLVIKKNVSTRYLSNTIVYFLYDLVIKKAMVVLYVSFNLDP